MKADTQVALAGIIMIVSFIASITLLYGEIKDDISECDSICGRCISNLSCSSDPTPCVSACRDCDVASNLDFSNKTSLISIGLMMVTAFIFMRYFMPIGGL